MARLFAALGREGHIRSPNTIVPCGPPASPGVAWAGRWSVHQLGLAGAALDSPFAVEPAYAALFAADDGKYNLVWNRDQRHSRR